MKLASKKAKQEKAHRDARQVDILADEFYNMTDEQRAMTLLAIKFCTLQVLIIVFS